MGRRQREIVRRKKLRQNLYVVISILLVLGASLWVSRSYILPSSNIEAPNILRVALVDQLSETVPNPSFVHTVTRLLTGAGYIVDYFGPDAVTVGFFRNLPLKGYGLVVIRAHSTYWNEITIFTSEPYSSYRYVYEQLTGQVRKAVLSDDQSYFSIPPEFVQNGMNGRFPGSIIIMMGCTGLARLEMAEAFLAKGARVYISWDTSVSADRTDATTNTLLQLLVQGKTVKEAVDHSMELVGRDTVYGSRLGYYPEHEGEDALG